MRVNEVLGIVLTHIMRIIFLSIVFSFMGILSHSAYAACSPGIPCTDYDIISNPGASSSTDPSYHGPKSGAPRNASNPADPFANVSGATVTSCDGNFMNQIYSRAFMEASREVILSAQMIHKPDSVLEYSCFHQQVNMTAVYGGLAFSESTHFEDKHFQLLTGGWNTRDNGVEPDESVVEPINNTTANLGIAAQERYSVFSEARLDLILSTYLKESVKSYIDSNFSHTFLGDALNMDGDIIIPTEPLANDTTFDCSHMKLVWDVAKCVDFGEDDKFRDFQHFINYDPRTIPYSPYNNTGSCSPGYETDDSIGGPGGATLENSSPGLLMDTGQINDDTGDPYDFCPDPGGPQSGVNTGGFSNDMIRLMNNCDQDGNAGVKEYVSFNHMDTHKDLIKGHGLYLPGVGNDTGYITCGAPRSTGVPVITYTHSMTKDGDLNNALFASRQATVHYDAVCPNPACHFVPFFFAKIPQVPGTPLTVALVALNNVEDALGPGLCVQSF